MPLWVAGGAVGGVSGFAVDLRSVGRGGEAVVMGGTEEEGSGSIILASCMPPGAGIGVLGWGGAGAMPLLPGGGPGGGGGKSSSMPHRSSKRLRLLEGR